LQSPKLDLAVTFIAERSLKSYTSNNFWSEGGAVELGTNTWRGVGIAAKVAGTHSVNIGSSSIPLSLVTVTFGPRYRWHSDHKLSIYAEGLIGEADGFNSLFPAPAGAQTSANSLAAQAGGGLDYKLSSRFAVRVLEAYWQHTQLPNGTNNIQNDFQLGAGFVLKFGH
jgi:predicted porin